MEQPLVDRDDVSAFLSGLFDLNAKLAVVSDDVHAMRLLLEDDDGEEEAEADDQPPF